jgi:hypothetical protein
MAYVAQVPYASTSAALLNGFPPTFFAQTSPQLAFRLRRSLSKEFCEASKQHHALSFRQGSVLSEGRPAPDTYLSAGSGASFIMVSL